jgi:Na(+)/H(+) exchange regulatory cofactor NHE-RF2
MLASPWLCTIIKRDDFNGYGFSMYKQKNIRDHFIGFIGPGSPAEDAGLMEGDEIVKVNADTEFFIILPQA